MTPVSRMILSDVLLVNGVGSVGSVSNRLRIYDWFVAGSYRFATVIHPSAASLLKCEIEDGVQVLAGAIVQAGCWLGANVIVNTGARA